MRWGSLGPVYTFQQDVLSVNYPQALYCLASFLMRYPGDSKNKLGGCHRNLRTRLFDWEQRTGESADEPWGRCRPSFTVVPVCLMSSTE